MIGDNVHIWQDHIYYSSSSLTNTVNSAYIRGSHLLFELQSKYIGESAYALGQIYYSILSLTDNGESSYFEWDKIYNSSPF